MGAVCAAIAGIAVQPGVAVIERESEDIDEIAGLIGREFGHIFVVVVA